MNALAARFADDVLAAFANARLDDMLTTFARAKSVGPAARRRTSVPRAPEVHPVVTSAKTARVEVLGRVVSHLAQHSNGVRAEELRRALGISKPEFARAAVDGLATGELRKEGRLRATVYFCAT